MRAGARKPVDPNSPVERIARGGAVLGIAAPLLLILICFPVNRVAFMDYALLGAAIIHLRTQPHRRELLATVLSALAFAAAYLLLSGRFSPPGLITIVEAGAFLGAGSLVTNGALMLFATGDDQKARLRVFLPGATPVLFLAYSPVLFHAFAAPAFSFDSHLYAFEERLGLQASFWIGQIFQREDLLRDVCSVIYLALPAGMAVVYAARMRNTEPAPVHLFKAYVLAGLIGVSMYNLLPAAGPVYAFPNDYPFHLPAVSVHLQHLTDVRLNAMPSLHTIWVLLLWWNSRGENWIVRGAATIFMALTLLATLGLGEHYLIDLVAGVPVAAAVQAISAGRVPWRDSARWQAVAGGLAITVAWTLLLRFQILLAAPATLCWFLIGITLAWSLYAERRVWQRASASLAPAPEDALVFAGPAGHLSNV